MTAIHETAYPRIRSNLSDKDLDELYTPTPDDLAFIERSTQSSVAAFGGLVLLKTVQLLGYFPAFHGLPPRLFPAFATAIGLVLPLESLERYVPLLLREAPLPLL